MDIKVLENAEQVGKLAAERAAMILRETISREGSARLLLSTGASQFEFFKALVTQSVEWSKVVMFHLDEYVGVADTHPASFLRYLRERFIHVVQPGEVHLVGGGGDVQDTIRRLGKSISERPIDLAIIGIGENAHIAFNDPPADFETKEPYIVVELDEACKRQQIREGWFGGMDEVPTHAITMSVQQIMKSKVILSCVPHAVKANAISNVLESEVTPLVPASILRTHPDWTLYLDRESAALTNLDKVAAK